MCGIAGFYSKKFSSQQLQQMTTRLQHRGPDANGYFFDEKCGIGLGHRRLSIIDLSAAANQPFYSQDGRYIMIYNGEVYNYKEVAAKYNIQQRTSSDSEVIIEAFAKAGVESFNDLNGMFAIAIWDKLEEKLYLVRDRIGIKPLYYYSNDGDFAFASELKAFEGFPFQRIINEDSVADFLYLGYIPGDASIYKHFKKILPGYYAIYHKGLLSSYPYWWPDSKLEPSVLNNEQEAKAKLKSLLESSVNYCMISDVPVGIFLSGGIDSSTVAAIAQAGNSTPVKTFSIGFNDAKYNESHFASEVAKEIKSDHEELIVTEDHALHLADKMVDLYDEPYADSSAIPTYMVSQLARKKVTVALSGDGGDELFMGYGFYQWARRLDYPLIKTLRQPLSKALYYFGSNRIKRASSLINYPSARKKSHIFSQEQYYFTRQELNSLLRLNGELTINEYNCTYNRELNSIEEQSLFDIKNYLPEELLVKTDRASMAHALEVRVPLLDYRLVEFAINLSMSLKLNGNTGKYLLRQVLYDYLPEKLFARPKWGFSIPLGKWLTKELHYMIDKYLDEKLINECGLVHTGPVQQLVKDFMQGKDYLYNRIWALIILHKWYKEKHK
jgi:asparagine synthase (glutamine-hydrolysing)